MKRWFLANFELKDCKNAVQNLKCKCIFTWMSGCCRWRGDELVNECWTPNWAGFYIVSELRKFISDNNALNFFAFFWNWLRKVLQFVTTFLDYKLCLYYKNIMNDTPRVVSEWHHNQVYRLQLSIMLLESLIMLLHNFYSTSNRHHSWQLSYDDHNKIIVKATDKTAHH